MIILVAATVMLASCGFTQSSTTSNTSAQSTAKTTTSSSTTALSAGQGAGGALNALYAQYKADGNKYDYKNLNNIINSLQLVSACEGLKDNKSNKEYLKSFGKGMLASAAGLVTESNVNQVTNTLTDMVVSNPTVTGAASTAAEKLNTAAQTASSISSILGLFAGK